jgi:ubiquinone/menaquinone biosynthesis C-methylase UbiE
MNANRIASSYRWLEYGAFGRALEHARFDFLSHAAQADRVLILGEGDGRFLAQLLRCNRHAAIVVIEKSARMIDLARRRVPTSERSRVEFRHMDALAGCLPEGPFDLAVTHFFLDIFHCRDAAALIVKVSAVLAPGASWLVSEFQEPSGDFRLWHARLWLRTMYGFFSATTGLGVSKLPPYRDLLKGSGFTEIDYRERRFGLIRSQVWRKRV